MDLAEVFTEMGYYEVSSQILFQCCRKMKAKLIAISTWDVITWDCRIMRKPRSVLKGIFLWSRTVYTRMKRVNCVTFLKARNFMLKLRIDVINPAKEKLYRMANKGKNYLDAGDYKRPYVAWKMLYQKIRPWYLQRIILPWHISV